MGESQCEASVTQRETIFSLFAKVDIFSLARTRMYELFALPGTDFRLF